MTVYNYSATLMNGESKQLNDYKGKVMLIVNTATKCGFSEQLKELQVLYDRYQDRGLIVLGFPCDQFKNQEPGTNEETNKVCQKHFGITFPLFQKVNVKGSKTHPLFEYLTSETKGMMTNQIKWNFTKFLINRAGHVVNRYAPITPPKKIAQDIETLLD